MIHLQYNHHDDYFDEPNDAWALRSIRGMNDHESAHDRVDDDDDFSRKDASDDLPFLFSCSSRNCSRVSPEALQPIQGRQTHYVFCDRVGVRRDTFLTWLVSL